MSSPADEARASRCGAWSISACGVTGSGSACRSMRVAIVSFSPLATDTRVLRTAETLAACGHEILLAGHPPEPLLEGAARHIVPSPRPDLRNRFALAAVMTPA